MPGLDRSGQGQGNPLLLNVLPPDLGRRQGLGREQLLQQSMGLGDDEGRERYPYEGDGDPPKDEQVAGEAEAKAPVPLVEGGDADFGQMDLALALDNPEDLLKKEGHEAH